MPKVKKRNLTKSIRGKTKKSVKSVLSAKNLSKAKTKNKTAKVKGQKISRKMKLSKPKKSMTSSITQRKNTSSVGTDLLHEMRRLNSKTDDVHALLETILYITTHAFVEENDVENESVKNTEVEQNPHDVFYQTPQYIIEETEKRSEIREVAMA